MLEKIEKAIVPALNKLNLSLYELSYVHENNENYLRVYVDSNSTIDMDMVVEASHVISEILDDIDPIDSEYILEVASAGAEKELKSKDDVTNAISSYIFVKLYDPQQGIDAIEGYLKDFSNDLVTIEYLDKTRKKELEIAYDNIKLIRLAIKF